MKKIFAVLLSMLILCLAACTGGEQGGNSGSGTEPVPASGSVPEQNTSKYRGFGSRDSVKTFLDGEWEQIPAFYGFEFSAEKKLFFEKDTNAFTFTDMEDGTLAQGTYFVSKADGSFDSYGIIILETQTFSSGNTMKEELYKQEDAEFQFFAGQVEDKDVLLLREWDGETRLGYLAFGATNATTEQFFVFERPSVEKTTNSLWPLVDQGFYAFFWKSDTGECYLQPVAYENFTENDGTGQANLVRFALTDGEGRFRAVRYNVNIGEDLYEFDIPDAERGKYVPRAVWVETDGQGYVKVLRRLTYYGKGKYVAASGGGSDFRDPSKYAGYDRMFLGKWEVDGEPTTVEIKEASPQVGGYEVELSFFRRGTGSGYANLEADDLYINQGTLNGGSFNARISRVGNKLYLKVTYSDDLNIRKGDEYVYVRASEG